MQKLDRKRKSTRTLQSRQRTSKASGSRARLSRSDRRSLSLRERAPLSPSPRVVRDPAEVPPPLALLAPPQAVRRAAVHDAALAGHALEARLPERPAPPALLVRDLRGRPRRAVVDGHLDGADLDVPVRDRVAFDAEVVRVGADARDGPDDGVDWEGGEGGRFRPGGLGFLARVDLEKAHI